MRGKKKVPKYDAAGYAALKSRNGYALSAGELTHNVNARVWAARTTKPVQRERLVTDRGTFTRVDGRTTEYDSGVVW